MMTMPFRVTLSVDLIETFGDLDAAEALADSICQQLSREHPAVTSVGVEDIDEVKS